MIATQELQIIEEADYLVTANTQDFPADEMFASTTVITPEDFIELLAASRDKGVEQHGP